MTHIHLAKEELDYMLKAVQKWHVGALEAIKEMESDEHSKNYEGYEGYEGYCIGSCILLAAMKIKHVTFLAIKLEGMWKKHAGHIELNFFSSWILELIAHYKMQSPIFLGITQKINVAIADAALEAKSDCNGQLQKQSLFADSRKKSEQKVDSATICTLSNVNEYLSKYSG